VLAIVFAVFVQHKAIRRLAFVFCCRICPVFAGGAFECNNFAHDNSPVLTF